MSPLKNSLAFLSCFGKDRKTTQKGDKEGFSYVLQKATPESGESDQPYQESEQGRAESRPARGLLRLELMSGVLVPSASFNQHTVSEALLCRAQPGDIFVATYPKTGTTWTQYILWVLVNLDEEKPYPSFKEAGEKVMPFLEYVGKEAVERLPTPRIIKHHLSFSQSPYHPEAKYLVIVRNPFDCAVSFYFHCLGDRVNLGMPADTSFEVFLGEFMAGRVPFGDYFEHTLSWYAHRHDPNVLLFYYEHLKEDQPQGILRIAQFVDPGLGKRLRDDEALLCDVVKRTSFASLKSNVSMGGNVHQTVPEEELPEGFVPFKEFFRKGQVGDWRNYFTPDQERRLRRVYDEKMKGTEMWDYWEPYLNFNTEGCVH